jgi:hypothetical protein
MTDFDPIKAIREELTSLIVAERQVRVSARHKDGIIDEATHDRDALLKAAGLFKDMIAKGQARLRELETEAERRTQG